MTHNEELPLADQHITQAEGRITKHLQRIEQMEAGGQDTELAKDVLLAMEWSLLAAQGYRQLILANKRPQDAL